MIHRYHECCAGSARGAFALAGTRRQYERSLPFTFDHVDLSLRLDLDRKRVQGVAVWHFERRSRDATELTLDAVAFDIGRVQLSPGSNASGKLAWKDVGFSYDSEQLRVEIPKKVTRGQLRIEYSAAPSRGLYFLAPDEHYPNRPQQVWSQCQDEDARHWFPCHDKPHVKVTAAFEVTVSDDVSVLCNGTPGKVSASKRSRTKTYRYAMPQRMPSYLFTLVAGQFEVIEDRSARLASGREVAVEYWVPNGAIEDGKRGFARTPEMIELFSKVTGVEYPYERYTQVVVSDFIFGGMENTSATTMYEHVLLDERAAIDIESYDLVAHELAHQWFGDWVTCKDWSHAWLNEGFATYFEHIEREHREGRAEYLLGVERDVETYLSEASGRYQRPIVCRDYNEPIDLFDRHLYEKGGLVLHGLRTKLGDEAFWKGIQSYLDANAQGSTVTADLRKALEQSSGLSLERYFDEFVHRAGHPSIKVKVTYAAERLTVVFEQTSTHHYELDFEVVVRDNGNKVHRLKTSSDQKHTTLVLETKHRPKYVIIDPELRLTGQLSIEMPTDMLKHQLTHGETVRARCQAASLLKGKLDFHLVGALQKQLAHRKEHWAVRAACARSLGSLRNDQARDALAAHVGTADPKVRQAVCEALGQYRTASAAKTLAGALKKEKSYLVRAAIVRALGRTRQAAHAKTVQTMLDEASWASVVGSAAADALATLDTENNVEVLKTKTRYGEPTRVRRTAALALARCGEGRQVRRHLIDLLDDPQPHMRADVAHALGALGDKAARGAIELRLARERDGRVSRRLREVSNRLSQADNTRELKDRVQQLERQLGEALARVTTLEASAARHKRKGSK